MRAWAVAVGLAALGLAMPALGQDQGLVDSAMRAALRTFMRAAPDLGASSAGVPIGEYRDALSNRRFASSLWGQALDLRIEIKQSGRGLCAGFAAYVTPAIAEGAVRLTICPQFFSPGADRLRETTILHEMVHVVAGPDECRAMAFTAQVQVLADGAYLPVQDYWDKNGCKGSQWRLPRP